MPLASEGDKIDTGEARKLERWIRQGTWTRSFQTDRKADSRNLDLLENAGMLLSP